MFDVSVPGLARFLYLTLDEWAQDTGVTKTFKGPELAAMLGLSERGIRGWLKLLEQKLYIRRKRGRRGYHFELSWSAPHADEEVQDRHQMPITAGYDRQQVPITPLSSAPDADHEPEERRQMPITASQSMPCPDRHVLRQRTYVRSSVFTSEEAQKFNAVRSWLSEYPGARSLQGQPDDEIVRQCLDIAAWDVDGIRYALEKLSHGRSRPTQSWAWFPAVFRKMADTNQAATA